MDRFFSHGPKPTKTRSRKTKKFKSSHHTRWAEPRLTSTALWRRMETCVIISLQLLWLFLPLSKLFVSRHGSTTTWVAVLSALLTVANRVGRRYSPESFFSFTQVWNRNWSLWGSFHASQSHRSVRPSHISKLRKLQVTDPHQQVCIGLFMITNTLWQQIRPV